VAALSSGAATFAICNLQFAIAFAIGQLGDCYCDSLLIMRDRAPFAKSPNSQSPIRRIANAISIANYK
jgi:hypothetical protein